MARLPGARRVASSAATTRAQRSRSAYVRRAGSPPSGRKASPAPPSVWARSRTSSTSVSGVTTRLLGARLPGDVQPPQRSGVERPLGAEVLLVDALPAPEHRVRLDRLWLGRVQRRHALEGPLHVRGQLGLLPPAPLVVPLAELRDHGSAQEVQRLADVLVAVRARLLEQDDLVHPGLLEVAEVAADLVGAADRRDAGHRLRRGA